MDNETPNAGPPPVPPPPYRPPPPAPMRGAAPPRRSSGKGWMIAAIVLAVLLVLTVLGGILSVMGSVLGVLAGAGPATMSSDSMLQEITLENNGSSYKIAVVPVEGLIFGGRVGAGHADVVHLIRDQLKLAARDKRVKAVLLRVNSPGGEVLASDEIYKAIEEFQKEHKKPVVATMGSLAASGGYYVAAPCRWIVANELTITGSIGVIMHTYNYRGLMNKVGLRPLVFKSGRFKDMLSGEKDLEKLTPQEKADFEQEEAMIQKMVGETFGRFKQVVGEGRKRANDENKANPGDAAGRTLAASWADYADGRILSGKEAYEHGFVDELGDTQIAIKRARSLVGIDDANLVTYRPPFGLSDLFGFLGKSETRSIKVDWGFDIPKLQAGLYYLAPSFLR